MGQYYKVCNLDKKQFLHPHKFGDGLKLLEFGSNGSGTMTGLAILLADGNGRGGGDLNSNHPIIGSWVGDRIVIAGDYADEGKWGIASGTLYAATHESDWTDISDDVIAAMSDDEYLCQALAESARDGWPGKETAPGLYRARERHEASVKARKP